MGHPARGWTPLSRTRLPPLTAHPKQWLDSVFIHRRTGRSWWAACAGLAAEPAWVVQSSSRPPVPCQWSPAGQEAPDLPFHASVVCPAVHTGERVSPKRLLWQEKAGEGKRRQQKAGEGRRRQEKAGEGRGRQEKAGEGRQRHDKGGGYIWTFPYPKPTESCEEQEEGLATPTMGLDLCWFPGEQMRRPQHKPCLCSPWSGPCGCRSLCEPHTFLLAQTPHGARITGVIESCPHESLFYSHIKHLQNHLLAFKDRRDALTSA